MAVVGVCGHSRLGPLTIHVFCVTMHSRVPLRPLMAYCDNIFERTDGESMKFIHLGLLNASLRLYSGNEADKYCKAYGQEPIDNLWAGSNDGNGIWIAQGRGEKDTRDSAFHETSHFVDWIITDHLKLTGNVGELRAILIAGIGPMVVDWYLKHERGLKKLPTSLGTK